MKWSASVLSCRSEASQFGKPHPCTQYIQLSFWCLILKGEHFRKDFNTEIGDQGTKEKKGTQNREQIFKTIITLLKRLREGNTSTKQVGCYLVMDIKEAM